MSNFQDYSWFREKKDELVGLIRESSGIIDDISLAQYAEGLRQLGQKVDSDTFKIQIVGTFKNGKSTFINALLGEDILPTKALPCTSVINEIKYGKSKKAILNFRSPLPETLLSDIPTATLNHMKAHGMKDVPPMEIEYDRISDYVTIPLDGDPDEISLKSPYLSVELFYPSPLLKEGVEIIDSPGLNENDERTAVTLEYLDKADAIIFLLDATRACAKNEMETIDDILVPKGFDDMFFVVNRFDLIQQREQPGIKKYVESKVRQYTTNEVYCVSSLAALDGKLENNDDKLIGSGLPAFEKRLSDFLTKEKGKIKLAKPAKELKSILTKEALFSAIPSQRSQLSTNIQVLRERYESVKPQLAQYESQKESLRTSLALKVERKENGITRAISTQFREIADLIEAWVKDFVPKTDPGVFGRRRQLEKIAAEISEHVSDKVKETFRKWNQEVLIPLVEDSAIEIFETSDSTLKGIFDGISELQSELSGNPTIKDTSSGWTRAIGVAGVCLGWGSGGSLLSGQFDFKTTAKALAVDLGVTTGLILLGVTNPILAIGGILLVMWRAIAGGQKVVLQRVKEQIAPEIRNSIVNSAETKSAEIVAKIDVEFQKSINTAIKAIDMKINDLTTQIEAVLHEKEKGEAHAKQRLGLLDQSEKKLQIICGNLDAFVLGLVEKA